MNTLINHRRKCKNVSEDQFLSIACIREFWFQEDETIYYYTGEGTWEWEILLVQNECSLWHFKKEVEDYTSVYENYGYYVCLILKKEQDRTRLE